MEFEVIDHSRIVRSLWGHLEGFFQNRRRQLQDWEADPPHAFGVIILLLVSLEIVWIWRLYNNTGLQWNILTQVLLVSVGILVMEFALAKVAREVGDYVNKTGKVITCVAFFNLSLIPLLLILPLGVLSWLAGGYTEFLILIYLLLMAKVLSNWREALEIAFEFSRLQSAVVLYLSSAVVFVVLIVLVYVSFLSVLTNFLTRF